MKPLAQQMVIKKIDDSLGIKPYPISDFKKDVDELYRVGIEHYADSSFVDDILTLTSDPRHRFILYYETALSLITQWSCLNLSVLVLSLFFKPFIKIKFQGGLKWITGILLTFNMFMLTIYWKYLELLYFITLVILALTTIFYLFYSKRDRKFKFE